MRDNMHNLFNPDNPVMIILGKIWDLILMNICFVITSLPIFTIGASLTALYRTTISLKENDPEWVHTSYLKAFRKNFRQATFLWLILLAAGIFLTADLYVIYEVIDPVYRWLQYPVWLLVILLLCIILFAFPLMSRYEESTGMLIQNAIRLAIGNFPTTILFLIIIMSLVDFAFHNPELRILFFSLYLFIGNGAIAAFFSLFLDRIFERAEKN
jgi:uncharacterized membrane protein YesL